jgi:SAM-dependent methyltransferase
MALTRKIARRLPFLSRLTAALERLETEHRQVQAALIHSEEALAKSHDTISHLSRLVFAGPEQVSSWSDGIGPDGLPVPPSGLRFLVAGTADVNWFVEIGRKARECLIDVLADQGLAVDQFKNVLDFGCGCGRVLRHWQHDTRTTFHGSDCNALAVAWCAQQLPFARMSTNRLSPPLGHRAGSFDLIYAFSVLTHLTEELQFAWMAEFHRVLRPGGYLVLSLHGEAYLQNLTPEEQEQFRRGQLVVRSQEVAGQNECAAFHSTAYVQRTLARNFRTAAFRPEGAKGNPVQDLYLLQAQ